jgi:integrase/recombinase XerD
MMHIAHARDNYLRWLRATKDLSPHTLRAYEGDLRAFASHVGADLPSQTVDQSHVVGFLLAQRATGLASTSIRRRGACLRGFLRWLKSTGVLEHDPWLGLVVVSGPVRRLPRLLSSDDLQRFLDWMGDEVGHIDDRSMDCVRRKPHQATTLLACVLMIATGVRVGELVSLRTVDLDLDSRTVRVLGKGRRERQVFLTNDWLVAFVQAYLQVRETLGIQHPMLFFNVRGHPLSASALRVRLATGAKAAQLTATPTPHMFRHAAATHLVEAGVDIRCVQRLLGHASISTTEIYTHVSDPALRRLVADADVLGALVGRR